MSNKYLLVYSSTINQMKNKTKKINALIPSKPNFLKNSKISKMLGTFNDKSLHKKSKTNDLSLFMEDGLNTIKKNNVKLIYVKTNSNEIYKDSDDKENINFNYQNQFRTICNETNKNNKYNKIQLNDKNKVKKHTTNLLLKNHNLNGIRTKNELTLKHNMNQKDKKSKDIIKSKLSELTSLKKSIFDNNNFKNIKFFKKLNNSRNFNDCSDLSNNLNTINYIPTKLNKYKKKKTEYINKKCFTDRTKIYDYININSKNKSKKISRNHKNNSDFNFMNINSISKELNKTSYLWTKQLTEENVNNSKEIFILDSGNNINNNTKNLKQKIKNENIFDKKKLLEKIKFEKITTSQKLSNDKKTLNKININIPQLLKTENFFTKGKISKVIKRVVKIDSCSIPGNSPKLHNKNINQDNYLVQKDFLNLKEHFILTIGSGHGTYGHLISKFICDILPSKINNLSEENIKQSFSSTNKLLLNESKIDCTLSGSSFSSIIVTPEKIISANVGICKGVLACYENGEYIAVNLTKDHNINDPDEMKRVLNNGGVIKNEDKIYIKNSDIPGINITRSFGDKLGLGIGILDIPYLYNYYIKGNEKFILLASNGIWKFIDSDESVKIIKNFYENEKDSVGALNYLIKEAITRWKNEKNYVEDITAILLFFE